MSEENPNIREAWKRHERRWRDNRYVYPVVSRRSGGVSIGINLNPDKACNFDCIYCQVDRRVPPAVRRVDPALLEAELGRVLEAECDGSLYDHPPCSALPPDRRGVRDIAFSGDGEPTASPHFAAAVEIAATARRRFSLDTAKIVLITDAAYLTRPAVRRTLERMDRDNGEIWAKLDAGTEEYFRMVDRPNVTLARVLENILDAARRRPLVIQSLFLRVRGVPPEASEIAAYCGRIHGILEQGGALSRLQLYTIARAPAESIASPLSDAELDAAAAAVRKAVPVPAEVFYGTAAG